MLHSHLLSFRVAVEVVRPDVFPKHHIIIEVNELLGEARDAVDVGLYGRRAKSGKVAVVLEDILEVKEKHIYIHIDHPSLVRSAVHCGKGQNLNSTLCVTTVTLGLSRLSQEGICPLVTMKMCRTQGACLSTERSE